MEVKSDKEYSRSAWLPKYASVNGGDVRTETA